MELIKKQESNSGASTYLIVPIVIFFLLLMPGVTYLFSKSLEKFDLYALKEIHAALRLLYKILCFFLNDLFFL